VAQLVQYGTFPTRRDSSRVVPRGGAVNQAVNWPLNDVGIANIVWCIAYTREFGGGVAHCPIIVQ